MADLTIPYLKDEEISLLKGNDSAATLDVKWAARLAFPGSEGPKEVVVGWCTSGYVYERSTDRHVSYRSAWHCTLCEETREDCLHTRTARQFLIAEIVKEAREKFFVKDKHAFYSGVDPWQADAETGAEVVWWFWNEVMKNERPVGQIREQTVWIMTLDEVLGIRRDQYGKFQEIFKLLERQRRLTLDGTIVCSYEDRMEEFVELEKSTGHKELHQSDFGGWACHYCHVHGDEYGPAPSEVPCIRKDTTTTTEIEWTEAKAENDDTNR